MKITEHNKYTHAIDELIADYKIKISLVQGMIEVERSIIEIARLKVKLGCYRSFLTDLKRLDLG